MPTIAILLLGSVVVAALVWRAIRRARRTWSTSYRGHVLELRNRASAEELLLDGQVLASSRSVVAMRLELAAQPTIEGQVVKVRGVLEQVPTGRFSIGGRIRARIYVDDALVMDAS